MTAPAIQKIDQDFSETLVAEAAAHARALGLLARAPAAALEDDRLYLTAARLDVYAKERITLLAKAAPAGSEPTAGDAVIRERIAALTEELMRLAKVGSGYANSTSGAVRVMAMARGEVYGELIELYRRRLSA